MISEQRLAGFSDVVVERDVPADMRNGTILRTDLYRPYSGGPFPVILMRLHYDKAQAQNNVTYRHPAHCSRHGYTVFVQNTRGRWRSDGKFHPFAHEVGHDPVEWAASLPHSNGRVGMYDFSYVSATQPQAALSITPADVYEYRPDLGPTAHVFAAGHSLRFQVSSSDFPQWDRNLNTGGQLGTEGATSARVAVQTVPHDARHRSGISLPVVPG